MNEWPQAAIDRFVSWTACVRRSVSVTPVGERKRRMRDGSAASLRVTACGIRQSRCDARLGVPIVAGDSWARQRVDTEPGAERSSVPVSIGTVDRARDRRRDRARDDSAAAARGVESAEVAAILGRLDGAVWLVVALLYGAGLRLQEALELRVKDVDFERGRLIVRQGKGRKDRVALLPERVAAAGGASRRSTPSTRGRG